MQTESKGHFAYHALAAVSAICKIRAVRINLRQLRDRLGLTLDQMAERVPYSLSMLSRWEKGEANIPSSNLPMLAQAYRCRVQDIFTSDGEPPILLPSEEVLAGLLRDVQQELPAMLPYSEWPRSAASALHMRLARLANDRATQPGADRSPTGNGTKGAQPRSPTKRDAEV